MKPFARFAATLAARFAALAIASTVASAQGTAPAYKRDIPAKLSKQARISEDSAAAIARAKVPNGKIQSVELEREKGKLIYSYDVKIAGKSGIEEVNVNAMDGTVVGVEHESPSDEKKEAAVEYHVAARYPLGGEGGWDYVSIDTARHRVFIGRENRVMVVDEATGKLISEIGGKLNRVHGVAFSYATGRGFITSGGDSTVTMFDLSTLAVLGTTTAADDADAILFDKATGNVFTMNGDANSSSVIDAKTGKRTGTIPLGGKPEFGVSDGAGKLYANIEDKNEIVEVDARAQKVVRRWPLTGCKGPTGLAIDVAHRRLFSGCRGSKVMAISDAAAGKVLATVPIGPGVDANAYDPSSGLAFSSNGGDGTLTVVRQDEPGRFVVAQTVQTAPSARTMALDPMTHRIYTVAAKFGTPAPGQRRPPVMPGTFEMLVLER